MQPYLLFHSLAEIVAATISFGTFLFALETRRFQNGYLLTLGASALFVGLFETLHCLAFPGMSVFPGYDANLSPQLWLAARLFQSSAGVGGLLLIDRRVRRSWLLGGFTAAFAIVCAAVFLGYVPDAVAVPQGLTAFKRGAEWTLAGGFLASVGLLFRARERFSPHVFRLLVAHGLTMAACEVCFTLYLRPHDPVNTLGHLFLLAGVGLQYLAILRAGLLEPGETHFRDLTQAKDRLERAQEVLRDADKHKNEFLAVLSHELRNPLAPIVNGLYILEHATFDSEHASRARAVIRRQVDQLARLVDDLLDVTRIGRNKIRLQRQRLDFNEVVCRTVEDHRSLFDNAGVTLALEGATEAVMVSADRNRLAQIVGNLLHNAAKFTPSGGSVTVVVAPLPDAVEVRVRDTGLGLAPEALASMFLPFVQADATIERSRGGLGLGLSLVKGLTELHGGQVSAHSRGLGHGAEFVVRLPLDPAPAEAGASKRAPAAPGRKRLLVVEDNVDAAQSLRDALELAGQEVTLAFNGPDGIAKAQALVPDAVLCDLGLPGVDGYEVARTIRQDPGMARTVLVALSGYALPDDLERCRKAGFDAHLAKPASIDEIARLLGQPFDVG